jgi:hypothetical protein
MVLLLLELGVLAPVNTARFRAENFLRNLFIVQIGRSEHPSATLKGTLPINFDYSKVAVNFA